MPSFSSQPVGRSKIPWEMQAESFKSTDSGCRSWSLAVQRPWAETANSSGTWRRKWGNLCSLA